MKLALSILFLMPLLCSAQLGDPAFVASLTAPAATGGGGTATYLVKQNFEGTGYDNSETWTESGAGTIDEDYTVTVLDGSHSLRLSRSGADASTFVAHTAKDEVWVYCLFRIVSIPSTTQSIIEISNGGTLLAYVQLRSDSFLQASCTFSTAATDGVSTDTTYHLWFHYKKGSGANAIADIGYSTDGLRPTSGGKFAQVTNGSVTAQGDRLTLKTATFSHEVIFDKVRVDDVEIGDNPE